MKTKRYSLIIAVLMVFILILGSGCSVNTTSSDQYGTSAVTSSGDGSSAEEPVVSSADDSAEEPVISSADVSVEDTEDESELQRGGGGIPWIDSDLKENVSENTETDPKEDFHLYANKDWLLTNDNPEGQQRWSSLGERNQEVTEQCLELLQDESLEGHDAELIRTYYNLFLDWDARNESGVSEIRPLFERILAAGSIEDVSSLLTEEDYYDMLYHFVNLTVGVGSDDPDRYLVELGTPDLLLRDSAEYSERTEYGDMYYGFWKELFQYIACKLGMTPEDADRTFDNAISLETKMSEKIYTQMEKLDEDYFEKAENELSREEVVSLSKVFPMEQILRVSGYLYDGVYNVNNPAYLELLDELYTAENLEGIKSLILVRLLLSYSLCLDKDIFDKYYELNESYLGIEGTVSDEEKAYDRVVKKLTDALEKVYVEKYGSDEEKKKIEDFCHKVIDTYRDMLSENQWVSEETKKNAIEKLDHLKINAAYPEKFRDMSDLDLSGCSLIEATNRIERNKREYNISLPGTEKDPEMWESLKLGDVTYSILSCNAGYFETENSMYILIGIIGEPIYSDDMSTEELYAFMASIVGHEISHAFDSMGSQYDAEGRLRDWWTDEDKNEFQKRLDKMDKYLDEIVAFDGYHVIGSNCDFEMTADITGLQCALRMAAEAEDFDYDVFFTSYAQLHRYLSNYSSELMVLLQDEHPLHYLRTNVVVQQFDEFYETYGVKEGDNMYLAPEDRLLVW